LRTPKFEGGIFGEHCPECHPAATGLCEAVPNLIEILPLLVALNVF